jgi:glucokinase
MALAIGVDVGGTKVAGGVVDDDGRVLAKTQRETPSTSAVDTETSIDTVVAELRERHPDVVAVGIGAAGWVDETRSRVRFAPNLAWRDEPLRERVAGRVGLPVVVENDANAAAWAEHRFGAARGEDDFVLLTIGTGIGGGLVLDGRLYRGRWGMAGEPGHLAFVADGEACGCGNNGCLEQYVSGSALVRLARRRALTDPAVAARLVELAGGSAERIHGSHVTAAARDGDPLAVELFDEMGRHLGAALAGLAALLDPSCFVVGGGVGEAGELLLGPAREVFEATLTGREHRPVAEIRPAALGNDAGLVGAADLARTAT